MKLAVSDGRCVGGWILTDEGLVEVRATATVLATGGVGGLFRSTTNPPGNEGPAAELVEATLSEAGMETGIHLSPEGRPSVTDLLPADDWDEDELLRIAASAELGSEHPLGEAIVRGAEQRGLKLARGIGVDDGT